MEGRSHHSASNRVEMLLGDRLDATGKEGTGVKVTWAFLA